MKLIKRTIFILIILILFININSYAFPTLLTRRPTNDDYTEAYKNYLELSEEEKENAIIPNMYKVPSQKIEASFKNLLKSTLLMESNFDSKYSLVDDIPENMVVKNQGSTNTCWTFAYSAVLESVLALSDYKNENETNVYDFSERHLAYSVTRKFLNDEINEKGFNTTTETGGNFVMAEAYAMNGMGSVNESDMPFENNSNLIALSEIQNKTVQTQVYDTVYFETVNAGGDHSEIMAEMKSHIKTYGGLFAQIYGASSNNDCCNINTGAVYVDPNYASTYGPNHAVEIIGWDDDYPISNFGTKKPTNKGAWIVKNSWGKWYGDNGFFYVSYDDANIYSAVSGITKATNSVNYDNLYTYDEYGYNSWITYNGTYELYTIFDKNNSGSEFLTDVSFICYSPVDVYVYVNSTDGNLNSSNYKQIKLKAGDYESLTAGFHTLEFAKPLELTGSSFVVKLKVVPKNETTNYLLVEAKSSGDSSLYYYANIQKERCYVKSSNYGNTLQDIGSLHGCDASVVAHTKNTDDSEKGLVITTSPQKTTYYETQNFDSAGMKVYMEYHNNTRVEVTDYEITNGNNLKLGQTSVEIRYGDYSVNQPITVLKNELDKIEITKMPTKTTYYAGDNFDSSGMSVKATYKAGNTSIISDYQVVDGNSLSNNQNQVTISYGGKTAYVSITVIPIEIQRIEIEKNPTKIKYVEGQNFDSAGMIVKAYYNNGSEKIITNYLVENGNNLKVGQNKVTINYDGCSKDITIEVIKKEITEISIKKLPKTEYEFGEELLLTNGTLTINYNDGAIEEIELDNTQVSVAGFDSEKIGNQTLTVTYMEKTTTFSVIVKEPRLPENSDFKNAKVDTFTIEAYFYKDEESEDNKKDSSTLIRGTISPIVKAEVNDSIDYYIYLSSNSEESNIGSWIKLEDAYIEDGKLDFSIDISKQQNYSELASATKLYLYVKEVANREGQSKIEITKGLEIDPGTSRVKIYLNDVDVTNRLDEVLYVDVSTLTAEEIDYTINYGELPDAGESILKYLVVLAIPYVIYLIRKNKKFKKIKGL